MKGDAVYLHHILDAIRQIEAYLDGITEDLFLQAIRKTEGVIASPRRGRGNLVRNAQPNEIATSLRSSR